MPYTFNYTSYMTYTAFSLCNVYTVTGVTPTHSCGHISEWYKKLIEYTYFLVGTNLMIRYLNFLNRFPWSGLVIKSTFILFVGHQSTVTDTLCIISVTKNNSMFICLILLLPEDLTSFSRIMVLSLYW